MALSRLTRQNRKSRRSADATLNITSMMDMFTIILVFLLKSFSTQGQLVTPATGLLLPTSSVERNAPAGLGVQITNTSIAVEEQVVVQGERFEQLATQQDFLIEPLHAVLQKYALEAQRTAELFNQPFSGEIAIQGDVDVPYRILTRVMYTCGQAGFPAMNLVVYKEE